MAPYKTVAVAGATGAMGKPIVEALVKADFTVTALTREGSSSTVPSGVKSIAVDYDSADSIKKALQGQDVLISTLASGAVGQQTKLFEVAIEVGVKRLLPSEFGSDTNNEKAKALPCFKQKVDLEDLLREKTKGTDSSYTFVCNNAFLDWGIENRFIIDIFDKEMTLYDGGERPTTYTPLPFIGRGVVGILQHPEETANRAVYLSGVALSQKKLLEIAQRVVGKDGWEVKEESTDAGIRAGYEVLQKDPQNFYGWFPLFLAKAIYGEGFGGDMYKNSDNELLGLKDLSESDVEEIIKRYAK